MSYLRLLDEKLHVALAAPAWPRAQYSNGIVTYVDELRRALLAQGHRVSVFTGEIGDVSMEDGPVHLLAPTWRDRLRRIVGRVTGKKESVFDFGNVVARAMHCQYRRDPFDVIEMEESFGHVGQVVASMPVPVVVKLHGPAFLTLIGEDLESGFAKEKIRREGLALHTVSTLVSPSLCTLKDTTAYYGLRPERSAHIVNPLGDDGSFRRWSLEECDRQTILYVGRFDLIKGADLLIRAFDHLLGDHPGLKLIFVGPDPGLLRNGESPIHLDEFVNSVGGAALRKAVSYRGSLPPEEIKLLRARSLVTVMSSRRENQPYAALEAMLQACPVVCNDSSGLGELIRHEVTGLKAEQDNHKDLAFQISRVLADPAMGLRLGVAARAYVLQEHSPDSVTARTLNVYREAIARRRIF